MLLRVAEANIELEEEKQHAGPQSSQEDSATSHMRYEVDSVEAIPMLQDPNASNHNINPLEALLSGNAGFHPLLEIPPDADDEAMVELAIALSLQEHELGGEAAQQAMHGLQVSKFKFFINAHCTEALTYVKNRNEQHNKYI